ncbi:hypothetical protein NIA69_18650 [Gemmiger formicilis]|nr:hypothetical protein [Gemmiger formicilis]
MVKVHGSRMVGSLLTQSRTFAVFNGMDAVPTFDTQIEQRGKIMLQNIRYTRTSVSHTPDGILLSDQWTVMTTLLEDAKTYKKEHFLLARATNISTFSPTTTTARRCCGCFVTRRLSDN